MIKNNPIIRMAITATASAFLGLIGGLLLGLTIQGISYLIMPANFSEGPWQVAPFLGMSFGSAIGAIFGAWIGARK